MSSLDSRKRQRMTKSLTPRSRRIAWLSVCALVALGVGLAVGRATGGEEQPTVVAAPGTKILPTEAEGDLDSHGTEPPEASAVERVPDDVELHTISDGRGNELVMQRNGPDGSFYCEVEGPVEETIVDLIREPDEPEIRTPRQLIAWQLENTEVAGRVDEVVGEISLSETRLTDDAVTEAKIEPAGVSTTSLVDLAGADALNVVPGARDHRTRLGVSLLDPNRPDNRAAGYVYFELLPEGGWAISTMGVCYSLFLGEYISPESLPRVEPGPDTTVVDVGDPGNEVPENE